MASSSNDDLDYNIEPILKWKKFVFDEDVYKTDFTSFDWVFLYNMPVETRKNLVEYLFWLYVKYSKYLTENNVSEIKMFISIHKILFNISIACKSEYQGVGDFEIVDENLKSYYLGEITKLIKIHHDLYSPNRDLEEIFLDDMNEDIESIVDYIKEILDKFMSILASYRSFPKEIRNYKCSKKIATILEKEKEIIKKCMIIDIYDITSVSYILKFDYLHFETFPDSGGCDWYYEFKYIPFLEFINSVFQCYESLSHYFISNSEISSQHLKLFDTLAELGSHLYIPPDKEYIVNNEYNCSIDEEKLSFLMKKSEIKKFAIMCHRIKTKNIPNTAYDPWIKTRTSKKRLPEEKTNDNKKQKTDPKRQKTSKSTLNEEESLQVSLFSKYPRKKNVEKAAKKTEIKTKKQKQKQEIVELFKQYKSQYDIIMPQFDMPQFRINSMAKKNISIFLDSLKKTTSNNALSEIFFPSMFQNGYFIIPTDKKLSGPMVESNHVIKIVGEESLYFLPTHMSIVRRFTTDKIKKPKQYQLFMIYDSEQKTILSIKNPKTYGFFGFIEKKYVFRMIYDELDLDVVSRLYLEDEDPEDISYDENYDNSILFQDNSLKKWVYISAGRTISAQMGVKKPSKC